jgi:hypothetical protein
MEAKEAANINRLTRRIKDIRRSLGADPQAIVGVSQFRINDTDGKCAMKADYIADIDGQIDACVGGEATIFKCFSQVFGSRLAAA